MTPIEKTDLEGMIEIADDTPGYDVAWTIEGDPSGKRYVNAQPAYKEYWMKLEIHKDTIQDEKFNIAEYISRSLGEQLGQAFADNPIARKTSREFHVQLSVIPS